MFIIAENINIMSARLGPAIKKKDRAVLQDVARKLEAAGVDAIDVNIGPARKDGPEVMTFLVETLGEVVRCPLCLDTTNAEAMEAGVARCVQLGLPKPIINSFSLQRDRRDAFLALAAQYECEIIGLTMETAIPASAADRLNLAFELVAAANEAGVPNERILIDPVVLPLSVDVGQQHAQAVLEVVSTVPDMFDPPVRTVCGLSNISNGVPAHLRSPMNNVFLAMLAARGLNAAIGDVLDPEFMRTVRLVRAYRNESLFSVTDAELQ